MANDDQPDAVAKAFDRREGGNRDPAAWVRTALNETKIEMHEAVLETKKVREEVHGVREALDAFIELVLNALPERDPSKHRDSHVRLAAAQKQTDEEIADAQKLKKELRITFIKYAASGIGLFILSIFGLGINAYFNQKVAQAVDVPKATVEIRTPAK